MFSVISVLFQCIRAIYLGVAKKVQVFVDATIALPIVEHVLCE